MTSAQRACAAVTILGIALAIALTAVTQKTAYAQSVPVSGAEIVCEVFNELMSQGQPIPPGLDASGCDGSGGGDGGDGGGNGGGDGGGDGGTGGGDGGNTGGGGGGAAPACEDSIDNDEDGLIDMNDPGCESAADTSEENTVAETGDGAKEGEGTLASTAGGGATSEPVEEAVAVPEPVVISCDWYLTSFIREGRDNDVEQVRRLQSVLNDKEAAGLEVSGFYDKPTLAAVHALQTKYASEILTPWGETQSTGFVYLTTRKKINELHCADKQFPLTDEEQSEIERVAAQRSIAPRPTRTSKPIVPAPQAQVEQPVETSLETPVDEKLIGQAPQESEAQTASAANSGRPFERVWRPITDLLSRMFGR